MEDLFKSLYNILLNLLPIFASILKNPIVIIVIIIAFGILIFNIIQYYRSSYYRITKFSYLSAVTNTGRYGEYLTYNHLKKCEKNGGFQF